jgi:drug/metabolite transporter (DMT)-like permease
VQLKGGAETQQQRPAYNPIIFLLPALCDMTASSLMFVGLLLTHASVYQMLRGSLVIFTAIFSVVFLKRKLLAFHWFAVALVVVGTAVVGVSSVVNSDSDSDAKNPVLGDILVLGAQVVVATQMVVEEKLLDKYQLPPLLVVGMEGVFGFIATSIALVIMNFIPGDRAGKFENVPDAFVQMGNSGILAGSVVANIFAISFFNFFGVTITSKLSAGHRTVLDSVRTVVIWGVSLAVSWQDFQYLQLIGFIVLLFGSLVYNKIVRLPGFKYGDEAGKPLSGDDDARHGASSRVADAEGDTEADDQRKPLVVSMVISALARPLPEQPR